MLDNICDYEFLNFNHGRLPNWDPTTGREGDFHFPRNLKQPPFNSHLQPEMPDRWNPELQAPPSYIWARETSPVYLDSSQHEIEFTASHRMLVID